MGVQKKSIYTKSSYRSYSHNILTWHMKNSKLSTEVCTIFVQSHTSEIPCIAAQNLSYNLQGKKVTLEK